MDIIITESQENLLIKSIIEEGFDYNEKRLLIKKFLDDNFKRASMDKFDENGDPIKYDVVIQLTKDNKPIKTKSDKQLFYYLQEKFKNILPEKERDEFLIDTIKKWYNNKITKNGTTLV